MLKGYITSYAYIGFVDGQRVMFATETEYYEYMENREKENSHR